MDRIEHSIAGIFNKDIPEIHENISTPDVSKDSILKINDEIDILLQKLEGTKDQMEQECESKGRENQVFNLIKPLLSEIVQGLYDWMKLNKESVIEGADMLEKELQYLLSAGNVHDDPASIYSEAVIWNTI